MWPLVNYGIILIFIIFNLQNGNTNSSFFIGLLWNKDIKCTLVYKLLVFNKHTTLIIILSSGKHSCLMRDRGKERRRGRESIPIYWFKSQMLIGAWRNQAPIIACRSQQGWQDLGCLRLHCCLWRSPLPRSLGQRARAELGSQALW